MALPTSNSKWIGSSGIGERDQFVFHDAQTGTQYGDYRVDGGILTATGFSAVAKNTLHFTPPSRFTHLLVE
jgi:type III restriction enzyme